MTPKQRVRSAIRHEATDQPPDYSSLTPQMAKKLARHVGMPPEEPANSLPGSRCSYPRLLTALGNDLVGVAWQRLGGGVRGVVPGEALCAYPDSPTSVNQQSHSARETAVRRPLIHSSRSRMSNSRQKWPKS